MQAAMLSRHAAALSSSTAVLGGAGRAAAAPHLLALLHTHDDVLLHRASTSTTTAPSPPQQLYARAIHTSSHLNSQKQQQEDRDESKDGPKNVASGGSNEEKNEEQRESEDDDAGGDPAEEIEFLAITKHKGLRLGRYAFQSLTAPGGMDDATHLHLIARQGAFTPLVHSVLSALLRPLRRLTQRGTERVMRRAVEFDFDGAAFLEGAKGAIEEVMRRYGAKVGAVCGARGGCGMGARGGVWGWTGPRTLVGTWARVAQGEGQSLHRQLPQPNEPPASLRPRNPPGLGWAGPHGVGAPAGRHEGGARRRAGAQGPGGGV
jgi:hypothetical protein